MDNEAGNLATAFVEPLLSQYYEPVVPPEVPSDYPPITYHIQEAVPVAVVPQGTVGPGTRIEYVDGTNLATLSPV